jgi:hexosaminidase
MTWNGGSNEATELTHQGYTTITVPWGIGVPMQDWNMYICNASRLKDGDSVLGALLPNWEMSAPVLTLMMRDGIPQRQERTWGPATIFTVDDYKERTKHTDALLGELILPVNFTVSGLDRPAESVFFKNATITMTTEVKGGTIHYTLDKTDPTVESPLYQTPVVLDKTTTVRAALFDADGHRIAYPSEQTWNYVNNEHNLATSRPITFSGGTQPDYPATNAVDGRTDTAWWAGPAPQWLCVDLQKTYTINRVHIFTYVDNHRYYQYTVDVSVDGKTWKTVVDMSKNTTPQTDRGDDKMIAPVEARYVRVNMLHNSVNDSVHLAEVRVYEAPPSK